MTHPPQHWLKRGDWLPQAIDTSLPWLSTLLPSWALFRDSTTWPEPQQFHAQLTPHFQVPVQFKKSLPKRTRQRSKQQLLPYDSRIALQREVNTRHNNWHDFFNMLIWSVFPKSKLALHTRQHLASAQQKSTTKPSPPPPRTPEQNNLTRFDEGGALLICTHPLSQRLQTETGRQELFSQPIHHTAAFLFGHALFETMLSQQWDVRAMGHLLCVEASFFDLTILEQYTHIDAQLSTQLEEGWMCDKSHFFGFPLPAIPALFSDKH